MLTCINPWPGKAYNSFNPGWQGFMKSKPIKVSDYISYSQIQPPILPPVNGTLIKSNTFNNPTGGIWIASPVNISSPPTINTISTLQTDIDIKNLITSQTKFQNTSSPTPLQNFIFLQTNTDVEEKFSMIIPLNFGAGTFTLLQVSALENSVNLGDKNGDVDVWDFGTGPFTGNYNLELCFNSNVGPFNIGIRLEDNANQSSVFAINGFFIPLC